MCSIMLFLRSSEWLFEITAFFSRTRSKTSNFSMVVDHALAQAFPFINDTLSQLVAISAFPVITRCTLERERGIYPRMAVCKISPSHQRNVAVVFFVTISLNNLGFRGTSTEWTVVSQKNGPLRTWMAMKYARNFDICNKRGIYNNSVGNHLRPFSTWRTRVRSSNISPYMLCYTFH